MPRARILFRPFVVPFLLSATAPRHDLAAQSAPEPTLTRYTYQVVSGQDTSWQYVIRSAAHFQNDVLEETMGAALRVGALADSAGLVRALVLDIWRFPPHEPQGYWTHLQQGTYELGADSVFGNVSGSRGQQSQRFASPPGAMIFQWGYIGFLEQLTMRARALGKSRAEIPVYFFGTPGSVSSATVRNPPGTDSAIINLGKEEFSLLLDKYHRIESGHSATQTILHVAQRRVFPPDTSVTAGIGCPNAPARDMNCSISFHLRESPASWSRLGGRKIMRDDSHAGANSGSSDDHQVRSPTSP